MLPVLLALGVLLVGCGPAGGGETDSRPPAPVPIEDLPPVNPDTLAPPVANGEPMPPAEEAAGIPPYPDATVHMRDPRPRPFRAIQAFTRTPWDSVAAFYEEGLPGWEVIHAEDVVIFRKGPGDQATVTISPWRAEDLPPGAPPVLQQARTAIGAAWR